MKPNTSNKEGHNKEESNKQNEVSMISHQLDKHKKLSSKHRIYADTEYISFSKNNFIESETLSSLFFQKLVYYNMWYSLFFGYVTLYACIYKLWIMKTTPYSIVRIILLVLWPLGEAARIYSGYYGNIRESFPELITFILLSLIDIMFHGVMIALPRRFPIEVIIGCISVLFLIIEIISLFFILPRLDKSHSVLFYLTHPKIKKRLKTNEAIYRS